MMQGSVEIDRPQGVSHAGRNVAHQERGMSEIEFQVECIILAGGHDQRRYKVHLDRHREIRRGALRVLHLYPIAGNRRPGRFGESRLGIGRHRQHYIAGIGADREDGSAISPHWYGAVAQYFSDLIQLRQVDHGRRRRRRVHRDVAAAALRH